MKKKIEEMPLENSVDDYNFSKKLNKKGKKVLEIIEIYNTNTNELIKESMLKLLKPLLPITKFDKLINQSINFFNEIKVKDVETYLKTTTTFLEGASEQFISASAWIDDIVFKSHHPNIRFQLISSESTTKKICFRKGFGISKSYLKTVFKGNDKQIYNLYHSSFLNNLLNLYIKNKVEKHLDCIEKDKLYFLSYSITDVYEKNGRKNFDVLFFINYENLKIDAMERFLPLLFQLDFLEDNML